MTLTWSAVSAPDVAGYKIYYGVASRTYTNVVNVGNVTTATISNLVNGVTYYFAATCYNTVGLESGYSAETVYTVPSSSPTLNPLANIVIMENSGLQTVSLSGIGSGYSTPPGPITVTASSSNTGLVPNPTVNYISPSATGSITFTPVGNAFGTATITVTVNNGQVTNSTTSQSFTVTVDAPPTIGAIANQTIATNTSTGPIPFVIGDPSTPASSLTLSGASSSQALIPNSNISFGGSGSNRTVTLTPSANQSGSATITITVSDGYTNASANFQLTVLGPPPPPSALTIVTNGVGAVMTNSVNSSAGIKKYTLRAVPAAGQVFVGWQGSVVSSAPTITVRLTNAVSLEAVFIPDPFAPITGRYDGLFYESAGAQLNSAGYFTIQVNKKGSYSGNLQLEGKRYSFSGKLSFQCSATNLIARGQDTALALQVSVQGEQLAGQLTDSQWVAGLQGRRQVYNALTAPAPFAGKYTLVLPGQQQDPTVPMGNGYGWVQVDGNGIARFAGVLADGTKVSQSATLSRTGQWPMGAAGASGSGLVISWLTFSNQPASDVSGLLSWLKPASALARYYSAGFTDQCVAVGSAYTPPLGANGVLQGINGQLVCSGGDLGVGFTNTVVMGTTGFSGTGVSVRFSAANGIFSGRTTDPSSGQTYSVGGAVMQKVNAAYGFLLGSSQSSQISLLL